MFNYVVLDKEECTTYFDYINSKEYKVVRETEPIPFLSKISYGSSRGRGIYFNKFKIIKDWS